jgi:ABC-type nitrate/sulfonate/bicarbonate transport system permease component
MTSSRLSQRLVQIAFLALLWLAWQVGTSQGHISPLLLPPFLSVYHEFLSLLAAGQFWPDLATTVYELTMAFGIAAGAGTACGYAVSRSAYAVRVFDPLFAGLYAVPAILLFPLYVLFFGIGPGSKIAMGATMAFFPVVLNTIAGLCHVNHAYLTAARSMGASSRQMFWSVMLPAAFPVLLTGLRMGLILAFLSILGSEAIASFSGLGHRIVELGENLDTAKMFAYIAFVVVLALLLNAAASFAENRGRKDPA